MMNSLDALVLTVIVLIGLSLIGLLVMLLGKKEIVKKIGFYYTALAVIGLTTMNFLFHPPFETFGYVTVLGFGLVAVVALVLHIFKKAPETRKTARIMATISMAAAIVDLMMV